MDSAKTVAPTTVSAKTVAAGVLPFFDDSQTVLLGKEFRARYNTYAWMEFGGKREGNETLAETACREANEETAGTLNISLEQVLEAEALGRYVDYHNPKTDVFYRMYCVVLNISKPSPESFRSNAVGRDHVEMVEWAYFPAKSVLLSEEGELEGTDVSIYPTSLIRFKMLLDQAKPVYSGMMRDMQQQYRDRPKIDARYERNFIDVMDCSNDVETLDYCLALPSFVLGEDMLLNGDQKDFLHVVHNIIPNIMVPITADFEGTIMCRLGATLEEINARPLKFLYKPPADGEGGWGGEDDEEEEEGLEKTEYRKVVVLAGTPAYIYISESGTGDQYLFTSGRVQERQ